MDIQLNGSSMFTKLCGRVSRDFERPRHETGDVTCCSINEFISLPSDASISARVISSNTLSGAVKAQAFLEISRI